MSQITAFTPLLILPNGITNISFYAAAFGAVEQMRFDNYDGSLHVAELDIDGAIFHLHEVTESGGKIAPLDIGGNTVTIGLMVEDVQAVFNRAIAAGAVSVTPVTDYDYGYRQGELTDPFGHRWVIQKKI